MGMYDTVMVPCPKCGAKAGFQTKSGPCLLNEYDLDEAPADVMRDVNRHGPATCTCGTRFDVYYRIRPAEVVVARSVVYKEEEE